jgi:hypothetical protein
MRLSFQGRGAACKCKHREARRLFSLLRSMQEFAIRKEGALVWLSVARMRNARAKANVTHLF